MKYRFYLIAMFFILCGSGVADAEQYLCITDYSTGFSYSDNSKSWGPTSFKTADYNYIISGAKEKSRDLVVQKNSKYKVTQVGKNYSECSCKENFNEYGILSCNCLGGKFIFNKDNGRFLKTYLIGYTYIEKGQDENSNTPYMSIGKCSPF